MVTLLSPYAHRPHITPSVIADKYPILRDTDTLARLMLFIAWSAMPLLAIVGDVFGLVAIRTSAMVVVPLTVALAVLMVVKPHRTDVIVRWGFIAGIIACVPYDVFRLGAVFVGHLMGDFIPSLGTWIIGTTGASAALVGYCWRYVGDAAGAGVGFFLVACMVGVHRWAPWRIVVSTVAFAVCPVWASLMAVVAISPHGEEVMFPLNTATVLITLVGHLIFGLVLGLLFARYRDMGESLYSVPDSPAELLAGPDAPALSDRV